MKHVLNKSVKICYTIEKGKNGSLLFLHGLGGNHTAWKNISKSLPEHRKILIDLRGHGKSEKKLAKKDLHINRFVEDINIILKKEKLKRVTIVGHCFGSIIGFEFAKRYPKKVSRLILITPLTSHFLSNGIMQKIFIKIYNQFGNFKEKRKFEYTDYSKYYDRGYISFFQRDIMGMPIKTYLGLHLMISKYKLKKFRLDLSVKIVAGRNDIISGVKECKKLYARIKRCNKKKTELIVLKSDHLLPLRIPHEVTGIIKKN